MTKLMKIMITRKNLTEKLESKIFRVISNKVTIKVWDLNLEDGDRISLYLNGENILKDYQLLNKKHKIKASLKKE